MGFEQLRTGVPPEHMSLLKRKSLSIHPLSSVGQLDVCKLIMLVWQPIAVFVFALFLLTSTAFRYSSEGVNTAICFIGVALLLLFPAVALALLIAGVCSAGMRTHVRPSAVVYWTWWPFWKLALCLLAAWLGSSIGNYLYTTQFLPHSRLERMQAYRDVDPKVVSGKRLQDAGIVQFSNMTGVDRTRSGCIKNSVKYCVAPIVSGGELQAGIDQSQDLFMAGTDCCGCPGEFRCGAWSTPATLGGLRVVDESRRAQFDLAVQEWAATHGKRLDKPIFFEWVADPLTAHDEMYSRGMQIKALALLAVPMMLIIIALLLNGSLHLLQRLGLAKPLEMPQAAPGLGQALSKRFLPHISAHDSKQMDEEENWHAPPTKYVIL
mmetsp:Transcript_95636/g.276323  ORF Transcript_95636/g.276323 Transcript_95636/m.276323 type:complete len:378 (-) Transcript_95636:73-1206(-)|eukprot:CAMPEP_0176053972 /NCGR_PEP_ID=MMETSP0120_2-20121206/26850_1 /TAXON_ID=160619 /ORGANISM="Kryptoperidinium foliaceum, Strain CCMP 1326" /LENGTH=377 /DNA_ID=CAMNT_0017387433 /DNA_START=81 /DNA_END=1214 /DNA_ORIENTATION=-